LQYRWAALNLRKLKRLRPELIAHVVEPTAITISRLEDVKVESLPMEQGLYIFYSSRTTLYVGECENLRSRIKKHLEHSDIRAVARHFWEHGTSDVHLEIRVLPSSTATRVRRALEAELITSRHAAFNIKRL
jgi:excinuclease UvrABC nuclease subunit